MAAMPNVDEIIASSRAMTLDLQNIVIAFMILMGVSFIMRIYTRIWIVNVFEAEDWTMIPSFLFGFTAGVLSLTYAKQALVNQFNNEELSGRVLLTTVALMIVSDIFTRISFGYFFFSIFGQSKKWSRVFIYFTMISVAIFGTVYLVLSIVAGYGQAGTTVSSEIYVYTPAYVFSSIYTILIIFGDFALTIMSIYALWRIRLPSLAKLSAGFLLFIQCASGVASLARQIYSSEIHQKPINETTKQVLYVAQWTFAEIALGLLTANLALCRPLFIVLWRKVFAKPREMIAIASGKTPAPRHSGWDFTSHASFEITKTQVITVVNEKTEYEGFEGMERAGLVGDHWGLDLSQA